MSSKLELACRRVIASELRSYDTLGRTARIHYERAVVQSIDCGLFAEKAFVCSHNTSLLEPCPKCERTDEDCLPYRQLAASRIKELLQQLEASK